MLAINSRYRSVCEPFNLNEEGIPSSVPVSRVSAAKLGTLADPEFLDVTGHSRNLARTDQVRGDLADAVGRIDRELV
jgi:hypothetical protein